MSKKKRMQNELEAKKTGTNALSDEDMGNVSGGFVFKNYEGQWEVINDTTGDVVSTHNTKEQAENAALDKGYKSREVDWDSVEKLRNPHPRSRSHWKSIC